jgi:alpha-tubulin suppressor-like RCC1 family protein
MGVFDRLGFNYDSTKFGSGNDLTDGQKLYLNGQTQLKTWQVGDLANSTVTGYFQNPHTANLATLSTLATNIMIYANTANANVVFSDTVSQNVANLLYESANTLYNEIPNFSAHTDRMSGVTTSSTKLTVPDYQIAMAVGRQVLSITNQTDNIQNNTPILGNFTSLTIGPDITNSITTLTNDLNNLQSNQVIFNLYPKNLGSSKDGYFSMVTKLDDTLWMWGSNSYGQLGVGDLTHRSTPTQVGSLSVWSQIAGGNFYTLAIQSNGTLWAWGQNNIYGQLGLGDRTNRSSPVQVGTLSDWSQISVGQYHALAIKTDGTLWCWGSNFYGQLGLSNNTNRSSPVQVGSLSTWTKIAAGTAHSLAVQSDGTAWASGSNVFGELGILDLTQRNSFVAIPLLTTQVSKIFAGQYTSYAILFSGALYAWGSNILGQLGLSDTISKSSPVQVGSLSTWTQVSSNDTHTQALQSNGTLWAWGQNNFGQLGLSDTTRRSSPVQVGTLSVWTQIADGRNHSLAKKNDNTLWLWGNNSFSQLGLNNNTHQYLPVPAYSLSYNSLSPSSMNTFILDVQSAYSLLSQRRQGDTNFYVNSLSVLNDYQTVVQFNNLGVTSSYLIDNYIGTDKLKTNLAS